MTRIALAALAAAALLAAGCGGDDKAPAPRASASGGSPAASAPSQTAVPTELAFAEENPEGRFAVHWPDGCGSMRQRELDSRFNPGTYASVEVTCRRDGDPDHGCQVIVYDETANGDPPTPEMVAKTIGDYLGGLGVEVIEQAVIQRHGTEGVAVFCREPVGPRRVWVQGFIDRGRVFVAVAWGPSDDLFRDPQVRRFFDSLENTAS